MTYFHDFVKQKRLEAELTLREFCLQTDLDPSNWSKVERGILPPPSSRENIKNIAEVLNLDAADTAMLIDLALIGHMPKDILPDEKILEKLPVFFRTVRGDKPSENELKKLIELLKK